MKNLTNSNDCLRYSLAPPEKVSLIFFSECNDTRSKCLVKHGTSVHKAGQNEKAVTQGVPRFLELLNATKSQKIDNCKIFFNVNNNNVEELRDYVGNNFLCLTLKDLSDKITINMNKTPEKWYDAFTILYNDNFTNYNSCLSIELKKNILYKYRIKIKQIAEEIEKKYEDLHCVFSSDNIARLDIFVDLTNINLSEKQLLFVTEDNHKEIYIEECVKDTLEKMVIFGIEGIKSIYFTHDTIDGKDEWYIETDGTNFRKLLGNKLIDSTRLQSNNVWNIYENLGVEAARQFLIDELESIMDGVNMCHIKLLVDKMTFVGTISSISRYTLRKDEVGPMSKMSFEESVDHLIKSGFAGDTEYMKGVSASIMVGRRSAIGTGIMDLKMDLNKVKKVKSNSLVSEKVIEQKPTSVIKDFKFVE